MERIAQAKTRSIQHRRIHSRVCALWRSRNLSFDVWLRFGNGGRVTYLLGLILYVLNEFCHVGAALGGAHPVAGELLVQLQELLLDRDKVDLGHERCVTRFRGRGLSSGNGGWRTKVLGDRPHPLVFWREAWLLDRGLLSPCPLKIGIHSMGGFRV